MSGNTTIVQAYNAILQNINIFRDTTGTVYAKASINGHIKVAPVDGAEFENYAFSELLRLTSQVPSTNALNGIVRLIRHHAGTKSREDVFLRFGARADVHALDLADRAGTVVEFDASGWRMTTQSLMNFYRPDSLLEIPAPVKQGDYLLIEKFMNLSEDGKLLVLPSLPVLMMAEIERPIIVFLGHPGVGKTTAAKNIRRLLDPADPLVNDAKLEKREQSLLMVTNAIPLLDNLTTIPKFISDLYCAAFSGGGAQFRSHYTNANVSKLSYKRGLIITAISQPTMARDFLDRSIIVDMSSAKRLTFGSGKTLESNFELARPEILGGMLDHLVEAKQRFPRMAFKAPPRFGDFALYAATIAEILGYGGQRYLEAIRESKMDSTRQALANSDPLAAAFMELAKTGVSFTGDSNHLLSALGELKPRNMPGGSRWPVNSEQLGKAISRVKEELAEQGVFIQIQKTNKGKRYTVEYVAPAPEAEDIGPAESVEADSHQSEYKWVVDPVTGEVTPPPAPMPMAPSESSDHVPPTPFGPYAESYATVVLDAPFVDVPTSYGPADYGNVPEDPFPVVSTHERPIRDDIFEGYEQVLPNHAHLSGQNDIGLNSLATSQEEQNNIPTVRDGGVVCAWCLNYLEGSSTCCVKGEGRNLPIADPYKLVFCEKYFARDRFYREEAEKKLIQAEQAHQQESASLRDDLAYTEERLRRAEMTEEEREEECAEYIRNGGVDF